MKNELYIILCVFIPFLKRLIYYSAERSFMKRKYLQKVRNAMFWQFSSKEICDTLEDIGNYFYDAEKNGLSEQQVIEQFGDPEKVVDTIREERGDGIRKGMVMFSKLLLVSAPLVLLIFSVGLLPSHLVIYSVILFISVFLWFTSGMGCVIPVMMWGRSDKRLFFIKQILILVIFAVIQLWAVVLLPYILQKDLKMQQLKIVVDGMLIVIYALIIIFAFLTIFSVVKLMQGNIYMFFCAVQEIALVGGIIMYFDHIKRVVELEDAGFILFSYPVSLVVLLPYVIYYHKKKRISEYMK